MGMTITKQKKKSNTIETQHTKEKEPREINSIWTAGDSGMKEVACERTIMRKEGMRTLTRMKAVTRNRRKGSMTF